MKEVSKKQEFEGALKKFAESDKSAAAILRMFVEGDLEYISRYEQKLRDNIHKEGRLTRLTSLEIVYAYFESHPDEAKVVIKNEITNIAINRGKSYLEQVPQSNTRAANGAGNGGGYCTIL